MTACFITLLNMSVTAAVTAVAVMLVRAVFKKLPKWLTCALWATVGLRLLLPFSFESALSLVPRASTVRETVGQFAAAGTADPAPVSGSTEYFVLSNFVPPTPVSVPSARSFDWLGLLAWVWLAGAAVMLGYMIVSALLLKRRVGATISAEKGVYLSDTIDAPFVLGVLRPCIYLPSSLSKAQKEMILAHEKAHLKRGDHVVKPLAFLLLSVYWFNPVLWVAYALLCRDIELACDERVIRDMDRDEKAFYSQTLLDCGRQRRSIAACPLAFGEVGVKERVKNVLNYKKPAFWIILVAVIAGVALAVCFLTNPKQKEDMLTGVRVVYASLVESPQFFDVTESGRLVVAEAPTDNMADVTDAHICYIAKDDCFISYVENGKVKNMISEVGLVDWERKNVPVTDTRRAIFEVVADLEGYIKDLRIFENHNGDDRYFVAVYLMDAPEQKNAENIWSDVFQFDPVNGTLKKLCRIEDQIVMAVYPSAEDEPDEGSAEIVQDAGINSRIFAALKEQRSGSYLQGEYYAEAHNIYCTEIKDGKTVVYAMVRECWFGFVNDYFTEVSGGQYPAVFTFDGDDCKIERAQDGGLYADSVKELFPKKYANEILKHGDRYNDKLWNELVRQAKNYLKSIGRNFSIVCRTSEAGLSTLSDHGVSAEVSNKLTEDPRFDNYPFYGTEERIENGVRYLYSVSYDEQAKQIIYEKAPVGEGPAPAVERIVVNGETGEIISTYSAPVGPVEQGKDAQTDIDWIESAKIDETVFDVDGDGVQDRCVMSYGPTSGLFTFIFTVTSKGSTQPKYQNIFLTDHSDLSFPFVKSDPPMLHVQAVDPMDQKAISNYVVLIEDGNVVLRGEGGDMEYLGEDGGARMLRRMRLAQEYPALFTLNAKKGLDVYVWPWADGYCGWVAEHQEDHTDEQMVMLLMEQNEAVLAGKSKLTAEDLKVILSFYDLPADQVTVVPFQNPLSSYLWAQDGKIIDGSVTVEDLREMLGL